MSFTGGQDGPRTGEDTVSTTDTTNRLPIDPNRILSADGLDWTSPIADLIDSLTDAIGEERPHWSYERCVDLAEQIVLQYAE